MSLSSFLLKQTDKVDSELDALFKSQPAQVAPSRKRKLEEPSLAQSKRSKQATKKQSTKKPVEEKKEKSKVKEIEVDEDEDNSDLETNYLRENPPHLTDNDDKQTKDEDEAKDEDEEDVDPSTLIHESLDPKSKSKSKPKQKFVPSEETPTQRDARTIFIGNLPLEVAQKRPLQKQLQKHVLSFLPTAKIESVRFRSIPFSTPSTQLSTSESTTTTTKSSIPSSSSTSNMNSNSVPITPSKHSKERASTWRQTQKHHETEPESEPPKIHLTPAQKKKISFINQEFHNTASTVHAYIVFAHNNPQLQADRPKNLPPLEPCMDPYEAAKEAVKKVDGTTFLERMLRVDFVGVRGIGSSNESGEKGEDKMTRDDPKLTLFVGNLELASKEEDLRVFFDALMKTERGEPPVAEEEKGEQETEKEGEDEKKKKVRTWVTKVRIIRDKDTQLGKGFAYVQFLDRECVDEILAMEPDQLKFAKRKLRVQRCKTIPGTKLPSSLKLSSSSSSSNDKSKSKSNQNHHQNRKQTSSSTPIIIPKGDPTLGTKIAHLPKDERKQVKATDAERVARRLAKKKARMSMGTSKDNDIGDKKDRARVRKNVNSSFGGNKNDGGGKKSRVRSERHLEKRNFKKQ